MNLRFLGDALDYWKGSLFDSLLKSGTLNNFAVDPMASDLAVWKPSDFFLFSTLLRIDSSQILSHKSTLADRKNYFSEIQHRGDLFLDPDIGIATGKGRVSEKHIAVSEIAALIESADRLLAVYQHVRAQQVSKRVDQCFRLIEREIPKAHCCSYESGTVAMIFITVKSERIVAVIKHFYSLLGRHASGRIRTNY